MTKPIGPMFPYFGCKWRSARFYPSPLHPIIVEMFAGAAGYSLNHAEREVRLYDLGKHVASTWQYLLAEGSADRLRELPSLVRSVDKVPEEARSLVGYWLNPGSAVPKRSMSSRSNPDSQVYFAGSVWSRKTKDRLMSQVPKISHWKFQQHDWRETAESIFRGGSLSATVFVDPPYQKEGKGYPGPSWKDEDYEELAEACRVLKEKGHQVIVCERLGASWLPFEILHRYHGSKTDGVEMIWT